MIKGWRVNIILIFLWIIFVLFCILYVFGLGFVKIFYFGLWCFLNFIDMEDIGNVVYVYMYVIMGVLIVILILFFNLMVIVYFIYKRFIWNFLVFFI